MMYINAFAKTEGTKSINTCFIQAEPDLNTQLQQLQITAHKG